MGPCAVTELTAVNLILRKSGVPGEVTSLTPNGRGNASEAERCLNEESLRIQSEGWYFNTSRNVELTPDANTSEIALPANTITIDTDGADHWRNVTQRGEKLFDLDNNTDEFSGTLRCRYVTLWAFHCVPEPVAAYIACQAALTYYENMPPPREALRIRTLMETRDRAMGVAKKFNASSADANILTTPDAQAVKGRSAQGGGLRGYVRGL